MRRLRFGPVPCAALAAIVFSGCAGMTAEEFNAAAVSNPAAAGKSERAKKTPPSSPKPKKRTAGTANSPGIKTPRSEEKASGSGGTPNPPPTKEKQPGASGTLKLAWDPSPDPGIAGYRIRYGSKSGTYTGTFDAGAKAEATITGLEPGTTYYFVVVAYNRAGLESPPSNEMEGVAK